MRIAAYLRLAHSTVGHFFTVSRARLALTKTTKKDIILNYGGCRVSLLTIVDQIANVYCGIKLLHYDVCEIEMAKRQRIG